MAVKVVIEIEVDGDADETEAFKEAVYEHLGDAMDADELEFTVVEDEEEDDY